MPRPDRRGTSYTTWRSTGSFVRDDWQELLAIDADGLPVRGSVDAIEEAQIAGRELKIGIWGLAADLAGEPAGEPAEAAVVAADHEVFSLLGSGFFHTKMRLYDALTHPLIRGRAGDPSRISIVRLGPGVGPHVRTDGEATAPDSRPVYAAVQRPAGEVCAMRWFAR